MHIPDHITAGDSVSWTDSRLTAQGTDVDPASWGLRYAMRGALEGLDLIGASDGQAWTFALSANESAALNNSRSTLLWYWQAVATKGVQRLTVARGVLKVRPNIAGLAAGVTFDGRSPNEQVLAAIEAEIKARVTGGATLEYTIGQRSLKKEPLAALMQLRTQYRRIVVTERRAGLPGYSGLQTSQITFR